MVSHGQSHTHCICNCQQSVTQLVAHASHLLISSLMIWVCWPAKGHDGSFKHIQHRPCLD